MYSGKKHGYEMTKIIGICDFGDINEVKMEKSAIRGINTSEEPSKEAHEFRRHCFAVTG